MSEVHFDNSRMQVHKATIEKNDLNSMLNDGIKDSINILTSSSSSDFEMEAAAKSVLESIDQKVKDMKYPSFEKLKQYSQITNSIIEELGIHRLDYYEPEPEPEPPPAPAG